MSKWIPLTAIAVMWGIRPSRVRRRLRTFIETGAVEMNPDGDAVRLTLPQDTLDALLAMHAMGER